MGKLNHPAHWPPTCLHPLRGPVCPLAFSPNASGACSSSYNPAQTAGKCAQPCQPSATGGRRWRMAAQTPVLGVDHSGRHSAHFSAGSGEVEPLLLAPPTAHLTGAFPPSLPQASRLLILAAWEHLPDRLPRPLPIHDSAFNKTPCGNCFKG